MFQINPPKFPYKSRNISILGWSFYVLPRFHHLFKSYLITPWSNGARAVSDMPAGPQAWAWAWLKLGPQGRLRKILCVCAPFKKDKPSSHPGTGEKIKLYIYIWIFFFPLQWKLACQRIPHVMENHQETSQQTATVDKLSWHGPNIIVGISNQIPLHVVHQFRKCVCLKIGYPQIPWFITMFHIELAINWR